MLQEATSLLAEHWMPVVQAAALVVFIALGALHPRLPQGVLITATLVNLVTGAFLYLFRIGLAVVVGGLASTGLVDGAAFGPGWSQFLVCFLLLDFARYGVHWADHRVPFLWHFHRVHHSSEELNATSGLRMHAVDLVQLTFIPLLLFSVLVDSRAMEVWVVPSALVCGVISDAFQHANIRMDMTKPLNRAWNLVLNNPHFHCWHHTRDGHLRDGNYGNVLVIWDRLFGTVVSQAEPPALYGLPRSQALRQDVMGLQLLRSGER